MPRLSDAGNRIVGYVGTELAGVPTTVSVQVDGKPTVSTQADPTGKFVLYPVATGTQNIVVNAQGRVTALVTGVPVVNTAYTYVNTETSRILPPTATLRNATGTVAITPVPTSYDAVVRALKAYAGGPTVQVGLTPVDATNGTFTLTLPAGAPVRAPYVNANTPLVWTADTSTPISVYTFEASTGGVMQTKAVDVATDPTAVPVFTLP